MHVDFWGGGKSDYSELNWDFPSKLSDVPRISPSTQNEQQGEINDLTLHWIIVHTTADIKVK